MSSKKKFRKESQDARRHDQHNATHPFEKPVSAQERSSANKESKKS